MENVPDILIPPGWNVNSLNIMPQQYTQIMPIGGGTSVIQEIPTSLIGELSPSTINFTGPSVINDIPNSLVSPGVSSPASPEVIDPTPLVPTGKIPAVDPMDFPTEKQFKQMTGTNQEEKEDESSEKSRQLPPPKIPKAEIPVIEVPFIGEIPVPPKEQVILAGTTATASVAAALLGKSMVEQLVKAFKPIVKQLIARLKKKLNKDLTPYEEQLIFAFEVDQKRIQKLLQKEVKQSLVEQKVAFEEAQRHRRKF